MRQKVEVEDEVEANRPPSPINPAAIGTSDVDTLFRRQLQEQLEDFSDVVIGRGNPWREMATLHFTLKSTQRTESSLGKLWMMSLTQWKDPPGSKYRKLLSMTSLR